MEEEEDGCTMRHSGIENGGKGDDDGDDGEEGAGDVGGSEEERN